MTAPRDDDVVITGLGAVTPVGDDVRTTWDALRGGRSGVRTITSFDAADLPTRIAAEVRGFDPLAVTDAKQARRSARFAQFAIAAAVQAVADAGLECTDEAVATASATSPAPGRLPPALAARTAAVINTAVGAFGETTDGARRFGEGGWRGMRGDFIPAVIPNMAACQVAIRLGIHGPVTASALACASGTYALVQAARLVRSGEADVVLAGASDASICPMMIGSLSMMGALSTRNESPELASRPFDADRDGFVYGEGAVIFVVESARRAAERGARPYARYLGGALNCDAFHVVAPHPDATFSAAAIKRTLAAAGLGPADVDYVCAHGTSTRANDRFETMAIRAALGAHADRVAVSSPKSVTGHLVGAAGALSVLVGCLAIRDSVVPPTVNLTTPDVDCDLDYVPGVERAMPVGTVLANAYGFGGQNCSVVLGRV